MSTYIENFKRFRPLLNELVSRDIKIKYRRSITGSLMDFIKSVAYDDCIVYCVFKSV